ncbi:helix-turn-helix domain-containing protein [Nocardia takedensis]
MSPTGSTLPRRVLGRRMRTLREQSGLTADDARAAIGVGRQTLWRMETGQPVRLNPLYIERLCRIYGASEQVTDLMLGLSAETRDTGWWHTADDTIPQQVSLFVGLEDGARRLTSYQSTLIPGILQTERYRRALIWVGFPTMPGAEVERRVEWFTERAARLHRATSDLTVTAVLDEAALRRAIGGPAVMADQLHHLADLGTRDDVSVRVVPFEARAYAGLRAGPFVILDFPRHPNPRLTEPPIVYVQGLTGDLYLEKPDDVARYRQIYTAIEHSALDEPRTRALLHRIAGEYTP